jgi:hypothetical protein
MGRFEAILANTSERRIVISLKSLDFVVADFTKLLKLRPQNSFATEYPRESGHP